MGWWVEWGGRGKEEPQQEEKRGEDGEIKRKGRTKGGGRISGGKIRGGSGSSAGGRRGEGKRSKETRMGRREGKMQINKGKKGERTEGRYSTVGKGK